MMALRLLSTLILLSTCSSVCGLMISKVLGNDVKFPFSASCGAEKTQRLFLHVRGSPPRLVASRTGAQVSPGPLYTDRLNHSDSLLLLKHVRMNDAGLYQLTCNDRVETLMELQLFFPVETVSAEGQTVDLPCHSVTLGGSVESVKWEKSSGQVVLEVDGLSGSWTPGEEFQGSRLSVSRDWKETGDLSLRMEVKEEHGGLFFCSVTEGRVKTSKAAVRLTVRPNITDPESSETSEQPQESHCAETYWRKLFITAAVVLSLILLLFMAAAGCFLKRIRQRVLKASSQDRKKEDECNTDGIPLNPREAEEGIQPLRPHHPLINQGATCYLSSILQVLFMTPEFHHRLNPSNTLDQQLEATFKSLKERSCGTENITDSLDIKNVYQQRDAAECLERILNKVSPEASQVFKGQLKDTTRCSKGHVIMEETSPFFTLPLSLQGGHEAPCSLKTSFSEFFLRTEHTGDDMVYCTECSQKTEGSSGYEMVDSPQIMTLLLKRFYFDFNTKSDMKSNCCVEVPFKIQAMDQSYTLYGMVNHMGSLGGGHYTATVWSREDNTWYHCDDGQVTEVEQQEFGSNETYRSRSAYLLMYRASEADRGVHQRGGQTQTPQTKI
ncbi:uncharacterized protein LOC115385837 isoform X3 [Salarias fasciatus]|uniref:uncharacterized protein LOC115385837 isoform X3 n=1 Tax=Salarias fasciatus TaxID=181472 RepID=UPI0011768EE4|nr:uncharacterized protein LOC115385837 isoform X3 [Salarias fasciatus]